MHASPPSADRSGVAQSVRFWPLLAIATLTLVAQPLVGPLLGHGGLLALNSLLWGAGAFAMARSRSILIVCCVLGGASVILESLLLAGAGPGFGIVILLHLSAIGFLIVLGVAILGAVVRAKTVTTDTVLGGICAYLMVGVLFAFLYSLTEVIGPGSFALPSWMADSTMVCVAFDSDARSGSAANADASHALYFSFTTLTTLGYGDLAPRSAIARSLTSIEAVVGQLYVAVLIARLVSNAVPMFAHKGATTAE